MTWNKLRKLNKILSNKRIDIKMTLFNIYNNDKECRIHRKSYMKIISKFNFIIKNNNIVMEIKLLVVH